MTKPEPVAWIQHHKGGDNLVWDDPGGKKTAIYTADALRQARVDALREAVDAIHSVYAEAIDDPIPPHPRRLVDAIRALIEKGNEHE